MTISKIIDGKKLAEQVTQEVQDEASAWSEQTGRKLRLVVLWAGSNPSSEIYIRNKQKACEKAGISSDLIHLPETVNQMTLLNEIGKLNADQAIDGILVQLPLPAGLDAFEILNSIDPLKDVDGFHTENIGRLWSGSHLVAPCTPSGIIRMLESSSVPIHGLYAVIIGRSLSVGKPLAALLLEKNATVTIAHSRSHNLPEICCSADILVAAIGKPGFVTGEYIKEGAVVIDVGINRITSAEAKPRWLQDQSPLKSPLETKGFATIGDVDPIDVREKASRFSPVPGGVGPMTVAMLLKNTVTLAKARMRRSP
jgi:methylenetetrahydrofolate dehydrogenase (NADP+) / methenyltetrahydrofolate cyclohydrolase